MSMFVDVIDRLQARGAMPGELGVLVPESATPQPPTFTSPPRRHVMWLVPILAGAIGVWFLLGRGHPDPAPARYASVPTVPSTPTLAVATSSPEISVAPPPVPHEAAPPVASPAPTLPASAPMPASKVAAAGVAATPGVRPVGREQLAAESAAPSPSVTSAGAPTTTSIPNAVPPESATTAPTPQTASVQIHRSGSAADEGADVAHASQLAARGRYREAISLLEQHLDQWPAHAQARIALASLLHEAGRTPDEAAVLLAGIQLDAPHFAMPAARLLIGQGRYDEAIHALDAVPDALRDESFDVASAQAHRHLGQSALAIADLQRAIQRAKDQGHKPSPAWLVTLGFLYEGLNRPELAGPQYQAVLEQGTPGDDPAFAFAKQRLRALRGAAPAG